MHSWNSFPFLPSFLLLGGVVSQLWIPVSAQFDCPLYSPVVYWVIGGSAVGGAMIMLVLVWLIWLFRRWRRGKRQRDIPNISDIASDSYQKPLCSPPISPRNSKLIRPPRSDDNETPTATVSPVSVSPPLPNSTPIAILPNPYDLQYDQPFTSAGRRASANYSGRPYNVVDEHQAMAPNLYPIGSQQSLPLSRPISQYDPNDPTTYPTYNPSASSVSFSHASTPIRVYSPSDDQRIGGSNHAGVGAGGRGFHGIPEVYE
ncbi:hypothetical protein JAAARDRAFT_38284 [Jaapia argillacea MUCL 33604]|uniref:Uncharacterized protein n=1 Tax=Jaapia argillacea MUCL 33604 TaxID=933084 RepID=A0A067PW75_9AGAM|nr:hypothetical protein JAAARDRAFT_38284 [Jaapia argillacea MUCL 33604]